MARKMLKDEHWKEELELFDEMKKLSFEDKINYSLTLIEEVIGNHDLEKCCVACSFGKDSTVLLHLVRQIEPNIKVIFSNTGVEFRETLEFRDYLVKEEKLWEFMKEDDENK